MRWVSSVLALFALTMVGLCADQPKGMPLLPCPEGSPGTPACTPSKKELNEAKSAFAQGMKLQREKRTDEALDQFEDAARIAPQDLVYLTAREMTRQQIVFDHLQRGNAALLKGQQVEALAEFRNALHLDPQNEFAQQRLRDALSEWAPKASDTPRVLADPGEIRVSPNPVRADFHYRGDSRGLLTQVAAAFGVAVVVDDSVASRTIRFDVGDVDFYSAMRAACEVTHTFWTSMAEKQILVASESAENHRQFDRMAMRTFHVPGASTPQELNDIVNLLRTVFEIRFITPQPARQSVAVRAPERTLDAATQFMEGLGAARPQVMLDVHVYEISHTLTRNMGLQIPTQFKLFNIPAAALGALGGQNIQQLINQLISSGGINQANSQSLSALLAQLQGQQNSIFSQPLATFGGGLTFMGLSLGTLGAQLSLNESTAKTLQHATLRAAQGNDATLHIGARYPILNASFAPIFNTAAISQVIQNNSFQAPVPSFNYEDIGLSIKAKPVVTGDSNVSMQLEIQFRALGAQSFNGIPVISNREYKGNITLKDEEPAVVAGALSRTEQLSMTGIPGLGYVPGLNHVMTSNTKEVNDDELLIVITPHITSQPTGQTTEVWLAK